MTNKQILSAANARLKSAAYSPRKLIAIHAGIAAGATFLGSLVSYLMTKSMDAAVGLAGLDTRTILSFFQSILLMTVAVAMPFWDLGYSRAAVLYAKDETPTPRDLLCGFRRFLPALRMMLIEMLAIFAVLFLTVQLATTLFMLSPLGLNFMQVAEPFMDSNMLMSEALLQEDVMTQLLPSLMPVYILWGVLALIALIFLFYRFRLASFALMDNAQGALAAFRISNQKTRGKRLQLFQLDLHFWWYYVLSLLTTAVSYLDMVLPKLGITLNADVAFWLFFCLGLAGSFLLRLLAAPKLQTAYAQFLVNNE